jgi:prepilin-type N-terminal cleavage/methylation domain-containing protein
MRQRRRARRTRDDAGFTLVEVLVSIAVMTAVLTALTVFFTRAMRSVNQQGDRQTAIQLASDGMERMREVPGPLVTAWLTTKSNPANAETIARNGITYTRAWDAPRVLSVRPALLYAVVRVSWRGACVGNVCSYAAATQVSTAAADPVFDAVGS